MIKKAKEKLFKFIEENEKVELSEDFKAKVSEMFDIVVMEKDSKITELEDVLKESKSEIESLQEEIVKIKDVTLETVKEEVESYKEDLVEKLDSFLESELVNLVPQEIIESAAKVGIYEPLIEGVKSMFSEKNIDLDSEGFGILKDAKSEIVGLRDDYNKAISEKVELEKKAEELLAHYVLEQKCEGLMPEQKAKVKSLFKGDSVDTIEEKFESVRDLIIESKDETSDDESVAVVEEKKSVNVLDYTLSEGRVIKEEEDLGQKYL